MSFAWQSTLCAQQRAGLGLFAALVSAFRSRMWGFATVSLPLHNQGTCAEVSMFGFQQCGRAARNVNGLRPKACDDGDLGCRVLRHEFMLGGPYEPQKLG